MCTKHTHGVSHSEVLVPNWPPHTEGKERPEREAGHSALVAGSSPVTTRQVNPHLPARILTVYTEPSRGSVTHSAQMVSQTTPSLEDESLHSLGCGPVGGTCIPRTGEQMRASRGPGPPQGPRQSRPHHDLLQPKGCLKRGAYQRQVSAKNNGFVEK